MTATAGAVPVVPYDAERFVNSIGVNIQLGGNSPGYADRAQVKANLLNLGVHHVRNPLWGHPPPYATFNELTSAGIHLIVPTGYNHDGQGVDALVSQLRNIPSAVEGVEGVNEPDNFARNVTAQQLYAYQQEMYTKIKADPLLEDVPILALSLGNPYSNDLGRQLTYLGIGQYADIANSHAYPSIWMPENHSWIANMVNWAATITPGKPQIMTETGYGYDNPDETAGIYTPRLLLDLFCVRGLERSYIYQLVDIGDGFGGLYETDGVTIKAQGRSVLNLIAVFSDGSVGLPAEPTPLDFTLSGDIISLQSQLFQKQGGDHLLVLWRAYEATNTNIPDVTVTLNTNEPPTSARMHTDLDSTSFNGNGTVLPFTDNDEVIPVGGRLVILRLSGLARTPATTTLWLLD